MKRLEIISVRTSGNYEERVRICLHELRLARDVSSANIEFYVNENFPGDLAAFLSWTTTKGKPKNLKSDLGLCLADAMRRFGLVDHACWLAIEDHFDLLISPSRRVHP